MNQYAQSGAILASFIYGLVDFAQARSELAFLCMADALLLAAAPLGSVIPWGPSGVSPHTSRSNGGGGLYHCHKSGCRGFHVVWRSFRFGTLRRLPTPDLSPE